MKLGKTIHVISESSPSSSNTIQGFVGLQHNEILIFHIMFIGTTLPVMVGENSSVYNFFIKLLHSVNYIKVERRVSYPLQWHTWWTQILCNACICGKNVLNVYDCIIHGKTIVFFCLAIHVNAPLTNLIPRKASCMFMTYARKWREAILISQSASDANAKHICTWISIKGEFIIYG